MTVDWSRCQHWQPPLAFIRVSHNNVSLRPLQLQIVSVLLNESDASSAAADDTGFAGKNDTLAVFDSLANAVAVGAEAGEDIDQVNAGSTELQVTVKSWEPR